MFLKPGQTPMTAPGKGSLAACADGVGAYHRKRSASYSFLTISHYQKTDYGGFDVLGGMQSGRNTYRRMRQSNPGKVNGNGNIGPINGKSCVKRLDILQ
jgi:hypothetical protein